MSSIINTVSFLAGLIFDTIDTMNTNDKHASEEEAFDALATSDKEEGPQHIDAVDAPEEVVVLVPSPQCWSLFEYLSAPTAIDFDDSDGICFTIPCGYEEGDSPKYWFLRFDAGSISDFRDYFVRLSV